LWYPLSYLLVEWAYWNSMENNFLPIFYPFYAICLSFLPYPLQLCIILQVTHNHTQTWQLCKHVKIHSIQTTYTINQLLTS